MSLGYFDTVRLMAREILAHPTPVARAWSVQGLGMLRLYLAPHIRLHVWDRQLLVPGASPLHTHPWDFESFVVAGQMMNRRYLEGSIPVPEGSLFRFNRVKIQCGEAAHAVGAAEQVALEERPYEYYTAGDSYRQQAEEIHWSLPEDGTVTICTRQFREDRDHAFVYWRGKGPWVDAKPRPATDDEVVDVCHRALETWF